MYRILLVALFVGTVLNGCAFDVYRIKLTPVQIDTTGVTKPSFMLSENVDFAIGYGYERRLQKDTVWTYQGHVPAGDVYYSGDQVLTVEASNIYEAYLVISNKDLVGFYLPVEDAYYPLEKKVHLPMVMVGSAL